MRHNSYDDEGDVNRGENIIKNARNLNELRIFGNRRCGNKSK